jgi:hypothetical protein
MEDIMTQLEDLNVSELSQIMARCKALRAEKIDAVKARRAEIKEEMEGLKMRAPRGSGAAPVVEDAKPKKSKKSKRRRAVE